MKTKYVCHGLISPHVNFDVDGGGGNCNFTCKKLQVGGKEKQPYIEARVRWGEKEQEPSCFKSLIMKTKICLSWPY